MKNGEGGDELKFAAGEFAKELSGFVEVARLFIDPAIACNHGVAGDDHGVRAFDGNFPGFGFGELCE